MAPHLGTIFNESAEEGIFPDLLKHSKLVLYFKSGDKRVSSDIKSVSVLPVFSKAFKKVILNQLSNHFN